MTELAHPGERENHVLEAMIQADFGMQVKGLKAVEHYHSQNVVRIGDNEVVRIAKNSPSTFDVTVAGYSLLRDHSVPVPEVLGYQETPKNIGAPTLVLSRVPGEILYNIPTGSPEEHTTNFAKAGRTLRKIHESPVTGFGRLKIVNGELHGAYPSWREYWETRKKDDVINAMLHEGTISYSEYQAITEALHFATNREVQHASFLHNDFHSKNILFEHEEVSGVIDLCSAIAGDPLYDLASSLMFQTTEEQRGFLRGYGDCDQEAVRQYMVLIAGLKIDSRTKEGKQEKVTKYRQKLHDAMNQSLQ